MSAAPKWTPGPWRCKQLFGHNRGWAIFWSDDSKPGKWQRRLDDPKCSGEFSEANARLIAEAPAMVEALRKAKAHMLRTYHSDLPEYAELCTLLARLDGAA